MTFVIESKMLAKSEKNRIESKMPERTLGKVIFVIKSKTLAKSEMNRIKKA